MPLVEPGGGRHQFDGGDAEASQMLDRRRVREPREGAAQCGWNVGMVLREPAYVQLVDDLAVETDRRPVRRDGFRRTDSALRHRGGAVRRVESVGIEHRRVELERPVDLARERIDEQLRWIEAMAARRVPRAVRAQPVARAGSDAPDMAVEYVAAALRQADARGFSLTLGVEQAELDGVRVRRPHGDIDASGVRNDAERLWRAPCDEEPAHAARSARISSYSAA